jgi:hypothetical protein
MPNFVCIFSFRSLLRFWCLILTLLGLPWILGFFIVDADKTIIFSYLFTIINSSQGAVIFFFHCIVSKSVRDELLKLLRKQKSRFSFLSSNSQPRKLVKFSSQSSSLKSKKYQTNLFKNNSSLSSKTNQSNNHDSLLARNSTCSFCKYITKLFCCIKFSRPSRYSGMSGNNASPTTTVCSNTTSSHEHSSNFIVYANGFACSHKKPCHRAMNEQQQHMMRSPVRFQPDAVQKRPSSNLSSSTIMSKLGANGSSYMAPISSSSRSSSTVSPPPPYGFYVTPATSNNFDESKEIDALERRQVMMSFKRHSALNNTNHQNLAIPTIEVSTSNPEDHSYSLIDNDVQYYCENGIFKNAADEENELNSYMEASNQYAELLDEEQEMDVMLKLHQNASLYKTRYINQRPVLISFQNMPKTDKNINKLHDLITMPEEYDNEVSIQGSNISDQDLFNLTSTVALKKEFTS